MPQDFTWLNPPPRWSGDAAALEILHHAGQELARLGHALIARCGAAPVGLTGGVLALHPAIAAAMRADLPGVDLQPMTLDAAGQGWSARGRTPE